MSRYGSSHPFTIFEFVVIFAVVAITIAHNLHFGHTNHLSNIRLISTLLLHGKESD